jgi:hypothetical protein
MKWLWIGFLLTIALPARADVLPTPEAARQLTDKIMEAISQGDTDRAFSLMKPYAVMAPIELDAANSKFKQLLLSEQNLLGDSIGYEFLRNEIIGSSVLRITELHRFRRHGMEWRFVFYNRVNGWTLNNLFYTDKIQNIFGH